jgi:hypothetical protein
MGQSCSLATWQANRFLKNFCLKFVSNQSTSKSVFLQTKPCDFLKAVRKPEGKRPSGRPKHRSDDNITIDLKWSRMYIYTRFTWLSIESNGEFLWCSFTQLQIPSSIESHSHAVLDFKTCGTNRTTSTSMKDSQRESITWCSVICHLIMTQYQGH